MNRTIHYVVFVVLVIALCVGASFGQCSDADKKALEAFDHAWTQANQAGDRAALERIYAEGFKSFSFTSMGSRKEIIDGTVRGAERRKASGNQDPSNMVEDHYLISCTAKTATMTHRRMTKSIVNGEEREWYSRRIHFLEKNGSRWQVVAIANHGLPRGADFIYKDVSRINAFMNRDTKWFERNMDDWYYSVNPDGKLLNKAESIEAIKNDKNNYESIRLSDQRAHIEGDITIMTGVYHITGKTPDGKPIDMRLRFLRTFKKKNGTWVAVATQTTKVTDN